MQVVITIFLHKRHTNVSHGIDLIIMFAEMWKKRISPSNYTINRQTVDQKVNRFIQILVALYTFDMAS